MIDYDFVSRLFGFYALFFTCSLASIEGLHPSLGLDGTPSTGWFFRMVRMVSDGVMQVAVKQHQSHSFALNISLQWFCAQKEKNPFNTAGKGVHFPDLNRRSDVTWKEINSNTDQVENSWERRLSLWYQLVMKCRPCEAWINGRGHDLAKYSLNDAILGRQTPKRAGQKKQQKFVDCVLPGLGCVKCKSLRRSKP